MKVLTDRIEILTPAQPSTQYWPELAGREFSRILIIKPSAVGDIVRALPVLTAVRRRWPGAHIAWLVASHCSGILADQSAIDEVIHFDRKGYSNVGRSASVTGAFVGFLRQLRDRRFDLVIDMQGLFRSGFFSLATGAAARIGRGDAREMAEVFYTHRAAVDERRMHALVLNRAIVRPIGVEVNPSPSDLVISERSRAGARQALAQAGVGSGQGYAVIAPGSNWETKNWPVCRFGQTAALLRGQLGLVPVVVGTAGQRAMAEAIREVEPGAVDLCGKSSLAELPAVIEGAELLVANDSGPLHIADALDMPLVGVFGPTDPRIVGPFNRVDGVIRAAMPCLCCGQRKLEGCPRGHLCMHDVTAEAVVGLARLQLRRTAPGRKR